MVDLKPGAISRRMAFVSIRLVLAISLLNGTTIKAAGVLLVLYALEFDAQPLTIGLLAATFCVFPIMVSVPAGKFADRFGARWLLVFACAMGTLGMLIPYLVATLPAIFIAAALVGLLDGIHVVLAQNLVGLLSSPQNRARNFSNYSLTGSAASLGGPLIAGFSIDLAGYGAACLYLALLALATLLLLAVRGGALPGGTRKATGPEISVRVVMAAPGVRAMLAASSLHIAGNYLYQFYMPVYAHALGLTASTIGIVMAVNAAGEIVVRIVLPRLITHFKEGNVLAYALYLGAVNLTLIPFFENVMMLASISFIFGLGMGCAGPIITILLFANAPSGRSGEVLGFRMAVNFGTKMLSPVVFGAIASAIGLFHIFWINALLLGVGGKLSHARKA